MDALITELFLALFGVELVDPDDADLEDAVLVATMVADQGYPGQPPLLAQ